jgi:hypothetical protein
MTGQQNGRLTIPIRLTDIPIGERFRAARIAAKQYPDDKEALIHAAAFPSTTIYWVAYDARDTVAELTGKKAA